MELLADDQFTSQYLRMKKRREEEERADREEQEQRLARHEAWKRNWKPHRDPAAAWL